MPALSTNPASYRLNHTAQLFLLAAIIGYVACIMLALLFHQTILDGAAMSLFVLNPFLVTIYRKRTSPAHAFQLQRMVALCAGYLLLAVMLWTGILYIVTDIWKPDHYVYTMGMPSVTTKFILLLQLQLPWAAAGLVASIIVALLPAKWFIKKNMPVITDTPAADSM
ncbi:MAG: hypothetical protein JWM56_1279 [Candidatus Peribacteria bacterium]|nr:hypothetical protein [Candidatus Peribacteria bacterium]